MSLLAELVMLALGHGTRTCSELALRSKSAWIMLVETKMTNAPSLKTVLLAFPLGIEPLLGPSLPPGAFGHGGFSWVSRIKMTVEVVTHQSSQEGTENGWKKGKEQSVLDGIHGCAEPFSKEGTNKTAMGSTHNNQQDSNQMEKTKGPFRCFSSQGGTVRLDFQCTGVLETE